jgi:hypothetical protein
LTELATPQSGFGNMSKSRSVNPGDVGVEDKQADQSSVETLAVIERIDSFRKGQPRLSVEEILSARHEGHKY